MKTLLLCALAALLGIGWMSDAAAQSFGPASTTPPSVPSEEEATVVGKGGAGEGTAATLWEIAKSGGWVMIPLAALSVIAVALIVVYCFTIRQGAIATPLFMNTAEALLKKGDLLGLLAISNRHGEALARVMQRTLDFATKNPEAEFEMVREVLATEGTRQASALNQQITYLADVGAIAPMVGLFGTVHGMIQSFSVLASDVASSRPMLLAGGVSVALVTTAAGLLIGIPALAFYAYFRGQVQKLVAELEAASMQMLAYLSLNYQRSASEDAPLVRPARVGARGGTEQREF